MIVPDVADKRCDPLVAKVRGKFAIRESVGQIARKSTVVPKMISDVNLPNDSHGRSHQPLAAVGILRHDVNELEDGFHAGL